MQDKSKETILTIVLGFTGLFLVAPRLWGEGNYTWMVIVAAGFSLVGIASSWLSDIIARGWFLLFDKIGYVVSRVILSVAFFIIVLPFGFLSRLFRKDLMMMKHSGRSTFIERRHEFTKEDLENPW